MPPAISDEELSDGGNDLAVIAPKSKRDKQPAKYDESKVDDNDEDLDVNGASNDAADDDEDDENGDEEDGGDEYIVEKILSHMIADDGQPRFEVKWEGFEKKSDRTWEPEENLRGTADTILEEYLERIGGVQELYKSADKALKTKKRGRPSAAGAPEPSSAKKARTNGSKANNQQNTPASSTGGRKPAEWKPPAGSWEDQIDTVDMTRDEHGELIVWLTWKNGERSQHKAQQAYTRAPQKMLKFYESKINFTSS